MSDLVRELRHGRGLSEGPRRDAWLHGRVLAAADEIERLERELAAAQDKCSSLLATNYDLRKERDRLTDALDEAMDLLREGAGWAALITPNPPLPYIGVVNAFLVATAKESEG